MRQASAGAGSAGVKNLTLNITQRHEVSKQDLSCMLHVVALWSCGAASLLVFVLLDKDLRNIQ